jgi:hypothetical protein
MTHSAALAVLDELDQPGIVTLKVDLEGAAVLRVHPRVLSTLIAAMREILDVHSLYPNCQYGEPDFCATCSDTDWPCSSVSSIYAALGVTE